MKLPLELPKSIVFSAKERGAIYNTMEMLLEAKTPVPSVINLLIKQYERRGGILNKIRIARLLSVRERLGGSGEEIEKAFSIISPDEEAAIIGAAAASKNPALGIATAKEIATGAVETGATFIRALGYPIGLFFAIGGFATFLATIIAPLLRDIAPESGLNGLGGILVNLDSILAIVGPLFFFSVLLTTVWISWSFKNFTRPSRVQLDKIFPWSIYRRIQGALFLITFAGFLKADIKTPDALMRLAETKNRWLASRIKAAIVFNRGKGTNLGQSFSAANQGFPDADMIDFLTLVSEAEGFEDNAYILAKRWLDQTLEKLKALAALLNIFVLGSASALIVFIIYSLYDAIGQIRSLLG